MDGRSAASPLDWLDTWILCCAKLLTTCVLHCLLTCAAPPRLGSFAPQPHLSPTSSRLEDGVLRICRLAGEQRVVSLSLKTLNAPPANHRVMS
ncbi:hypothetical protein M430DRAFT_260001 [Amorphotheca resinae ATCC 22711]|uniref:Uncharacterized protein n=1 Tax=Amorphotheca resinae ATCC 22711 TaxID=857342 RepID=A0A2T3AZ53_AMORE|nr:hypothetical protein M430DRAFT_260001 [Amorphotheca resinae ATCC 22711]PSS15344.1 hypothetical protein M430DRAFT_260001 [Amorphotheca resinae ATCC 22711]